MQLEGLLQRDMLAQGLQMERWRDEACPDPLLLYHSGISEVCTSEGGDALQGLYRCCPQLIKEQCHPLGHPHGVVFCVHHMLRG